MHDGIRFALAVEGVLQVQERVSAYVATHPKFNDYIEFTNLHLQRGGDEFS